MHMEKLSGKKIAKNMMLSVLAQAVSVLVGFVLNLIVPKFIPESDYSLGRAICCTPNIWAFSTLA